MELHSSLNMLHHVQKVDLCQSNITKFGSSELSYYRNAAKMSQQSLLQKPAGKTLTQSAIQSNEACVDVTACRLWVKEVPYFVVKVVNPTELNL